MSISVRSLAAADAAMLAHVAPDAFDDPIVPASAKKFLEDPNAFLVVAVDEEKDNLIIGFASAMIYLHPDKSAPEMVILEVGVDDAYQRKGAGKEIMNVMLATVTERTREIGIRRALGAKRQHIVSQFLVETVVLSIGGGALGVLLGLTIPAVIEHFTKMKTIVTPLAPLVAFTISAGIGVLFGLYPAWRAADMDPVEALRHE